MASPQGCCWVRPSTPPYSPTLDPFQPCGVALAPVGGALLKAGQAPALQLGSVGHGLGGCCTVRIRCNDVEPPRIS